MDCMNTIQENISYAQRDALIRKSMEFPSITLQRVRSLKSFSADARDIIWQSLAPNEVFNSYWYLQSIFTYFL